MFDFDEFVNLVSDLLCLREGVLFASPEAGRNLAEVLARQIPGPPGRLTIEVADLVELDGRWASLITQPDVVAAGGAGLRSLSDQGLHGDLEDLRARRQAAAATEDRTLARAPPGLPRGPPTSRAVQPAREPQRPAPRPASQHALPPPAPPPAPPPPPFSGSIDVAALPFQVQKQWKKAQEVGHLGPLKILEHLGYPRREAEKVLDSNDQDVLRAILCLNGIDLQGTSTAARATPFVNPNIPLSEQERRSMAASKNGSFTAAASAGRDVPLTQEECDPAADWERVERPSNDPYSHPLMHLLRGRPPER